MSPAFALLTENHTSAIESDGTKLLLGGGDTHAPPEGFSLEVREASTITGGLIVKVRVNSWVPFQETLAVHVPGSAAASLPAIAMLSLKHQVPLSVSASQLALRYLVPSG